MKIEKNIKSKFNIKTNDNKTINVNSDSLISVIQSLQTDEIKFSVNATRNDAFTLLKFTFEKYFKLFIEDKSIRVSNLNKLEQALLLIKYAYTEVEQNEAIALLATSLFARIPSPYATLEDAIATISEQMVLYPHVCRDAFIPKVYEQLSSRFRLNEQFLNRVSTVQSASKVEHLSIQYGKELVEHIQNNPGIYILSGPMASGKSQKVMLPLFEHFSALQLYPLLMSAKRSLAKIMISDARHYETVYEKLDGQYANITEFSQGVCGVVNTLLGLLFSLIREQSNILLIDEIEDVLSHCISNAIGDGSFEPKIEILEQLFLQIRRSHTVVLADAFISTETIDEIAKHSDKPIYICNGGDIPCSYPQVDLHPSEAEFFANLIADLKSGKRVLMFTDCANTPDKPQFDKYFSYCAQFCSSALQVDSNTIQLFDLNDLFSNKCNYQYIQFSPVVTSGIIDRILRDKSLFQIEKWLHL